jgi:3-hydroxybutyrate dehydrogenase
VSTPDLTGRRAVVTGAASGIGLACATALAEAGAHVVLLDREAHRTRRAADDLAARSLSAEPLVVDLTDRAAVLELALRADILVNNAGIQHVAPVEEFPEDTFRTILTLMVEAPFWLTKMVLPGMYDGGWGRLVHISSVHGLRASPYKSAYVSAKHALEGFSKVVALEGGSRGVTSNTICPAYVRTPLVENQIADQARIHGISEAEVVEKVMLTEPAIKRLVEPREVAAMAVALCGDDMSFVNGVALTMDGGWTAR